MMHSPRSTAVVGPMFSGKTEELLRRLLRATLAGISAVMVVPSRDTRHGAGVVLSHGKRTTTVPVCVCATAADILKDPAVRLAKLVAIDESQFFDDGIAAVVDALLDLGITVVVAGLDMDSAGKPFGSMPYLLAKAHDVVKLRAVCVRCGDDATHTFRTTSAEGQIVIGAEGEYEARCYPCWRRHQRSTLQSAT